MINNHGGMTGMLNSSIIIAGIPVPWNRVLRVRPQVYISIFTISVWNLGFEGAFLFTHWSNHHTFIIFHMCSKLLNWESGNLLPMKWPFKNLQGTSSPVHLWKRWEHPPGADPLDDETGPLGWSWWNPRDCHVFSTAPVSFHVCFHGEIMVNSCKIQYLMFLLFSDVSLFLFLDLSQSSMSDHQTIEELSSNHWRIIINYRSEICLEMELYMILPV